MGEIFLSIRGRVSLNVEALNMTESVGNYTKHRRVPIVLREDDGSYSVYFAPAISGESIAHGYQTVLSEIASANQIKVCNLCKQGIFLKSTNSKVYNEAFNVKEVPNSGYEIEKSIVQNCVVEDIGGFLFAEKQNVKRTSNFYVGYMIPVKEAVRSTTIEAQLHTRYALGTKFVSGDVGETRGQMIYYVELSSAPYTFSFDLDTRFISKLSFEQGHVGEIAVNEEERKRRLGIALDSIKTFIGEFMFGAKKTRFLPVIEWESLVIAVSDKTWTVPSPLTNRYIELAKEKLKAVSYNTKLFIFDGTGENFYQVLNNAIEEAKNRLAIPK